MQDVTLSDGTFLPEGTYVSVASRPLHHDTENYDDPHLFKPWRFAEMRQQDGQHTKYQMVNTSLEFVSFGHGRHAWYVHAGIRLTIAYINYPVTVAAQDASSP